MASFIGIDFGGTKIAAARFDAELNLLARTQAATPASLEELVAAVKEAARSVWADDVGATGVGPGRIGRRAIGGLGLGAPREWHRSGDAGPPWPKIWAFPSLSTTTPTWLRSQTSGVAPPRVTGVAFRSRSVRGLVPDSSLTTRSTGDAHMRVRLDICASRSVGWSVLVGPAGAGRPGLRARRWPGWQGPR